jgi:hypothetical protein
MDILSKDTLLLLRDEKLQQAVNDILQRRANEPGHVTVTINTESDTTAGESQSRRVTVRRLSA